MKPNLVVDTLGTFCPVPIIKTAEAIRAVDDGGLVEILSDDPAIEHDLPAWCTSNGHRIETVKREGAVFRYVIRKQSGGAA
jgi:tRNA 2-thiouridine synthesizing protein A